jgi:hypothetical protein
MKSNRCGIADDACGPHNGRTGRVGNRSGASKINDRGNAVIQFDHATRLLSNGLALALLIARAATAQDDPQLRFPSRPGPLTEARLATLEEVARDLSLTPQQRASIAEINDTLDSKRQDVLEDASSASWSRQFDSLDLESNDQVQSLLNERQRQRLREVWLQVNGPEVLDDAGVARDLQLTAEQAGQLKIARSQNSVDFQTMLRMPQARTYSELRARHEDRRRRSEERLLAVLTPQQRKQFAKMVGEPIEVDLRPALRRLDLKPQGPMEVSPFIPQPSPGSIFSRVRLAAARLVQRELKLDDDQSSKAVELYEDLRRRRDLLFQRSEDGGDSREISEQIQQAHKDAAAQLDEALDRAQRERLREIEIQSDGAGALRDPVIVKELGLTSDQRRRISETFISNIDAMRRVYFASTKPLPQSARLRLTELHHGGYKRVLAVLTPEQRERFEAMRGADVPFELFELTFDSDP